jgi:DNA transposition AAA+ family ATPase
VPDAVRDPSRFVVTKEHRRFAELCDAVRRERYIGVCHGPPGVGKTLSARHYASWDTVSPQLTRVRFLDVGAPTLVLDSRTVLYTPKVHNTPRSVDEDVGHLEHRYRCAIDWSRDPDPDRDITSLGESTSPQAELLIVDEADRLKTPSLEQLRDHHDRTGIGLILIGMPGIQRRLARYPQLYSRIGFAHEYRPLSSDELTFVLEHHWAAIGLRLSTSDFTDAEAISAVARITSGNFRLVQRLFAQIMRILEINAITTISREVVETAREALIIGNA